MLVYLIHKLTCMQFSRYNHWLISLSLTAYMKYKPMGLSGLEPPTSRLSGVRSNQLSYKPIFEILRFQVEMKRFELSTPCLQGRCSPN